MTISDRRWPTGPAISPTFIAIDPPNQELGEPVSGEHRVIFFGDSITDKWTLSQYFPDKHYINRGISGQTTSQMLLRFRQDVINLHPDVVVVLAGTNDIAGNTGPISIEDIEGNITSMAELARAHDIALVLSSVTPVNNYTPASQRFLPIGRHQKSCDSMNG